MQHRPLISQDREGGALMIQKLKPVLSSKEILHRIIGPDLSPSAIARFKSLSEQELRACARNMHHLQVLEGEHPFSLASLELKLSLLNTLSEKLGGICLTPTTKTIMFEDNHFEFTLDNFIHHYSVGCNHHPNQDSVISSLETSTDGRILLSGTHVHGVFDGVTVQKGDGQVASRKAARILSAAAAIGALESTFDLKLLLEGINLDLYRMGGFATTGSIALVQSNRIIISGVGDSKELLVFSEGETKMPERPHFFLGEECSLPEKSVSVHQLVINQPFTLVLMSDGVPSVFVDPYPRYADIIRKRLAMDYPILSGLGPRIVHSFDRCRSFCASGHGDDSSLVITLVGQTRPRGLLSYLPEVE